MTYALDLGRLARTGAPSVLNTQALRDLVFYNEKPPMAVIVLNAKVFGDRGGGVWQWSADSVLDDDFGVIVLPTGQSPRALASKVCQRNERALVGLGHGWGLG